MNTNFNSITDEQLELINGGVSWLAATFAYGVVVGYTNEKCRMDDGKHWYCMRLN